MAKCEFVVHVVGILFFCCLSSKVERLVEWCGVVWIDFIVCWGHNLMQQMLCAVFGKRKLRRRGCIPGYV